MKNRLKITQFKFKIIFLIPFIAGILNLMNACSSESRRESPSSNDPNAEKPSQAPTPEDKDSDGSVTLDYELGKDHYLFEVVSRDHSAYVKSYLDQHLLKEGTISRDKYSMFLKKAKLFISIPQSHSAKSRPCRGPFTVKLKSSDSTKISKGCRSDDAGALSRLVREGEFLLYSGN